MTPIFTLTRNISSQVMERWASAMRKTVPEAFTEAGRRATRMLISLTPPANAGLGKLTGSAEAYRAGKTRIANQMKSLLAPVKLKGRKTITKLFGKTLAKPITYRTKERWPDVAAIYKENSYKVFGALGVRVRVGKKFYVSATKFRRVLSKKQARVGVLASGWAPSARALDVTMPAFVSRQNGSGRGAIYKNFGNQARIGIKMVNFAPGLPGPIRAELMRRIPYAAAYVKRGLRANIDHVTLRTAGMSGLRVKRAIPAFDKAA